VRGKYSSRIDSLPVPYIKQSYHTNSMLASLQKSLYKSA
jgi:hypothetical protein